MHRVRAYAPGSIGNLGPGLDILGCAMSGAGDHVSARRTTDRGVHIARAGHPDLPTNPLQHSAAIAATEVLHRLGLPKAGVSLEVEKGLPLAGGQGGSAASGVAAAFAVNALVGGDLDTMGILEAALVAESAVAGRHADNVAAAAFGGIVLVRALDPLEVIPLPVPDGLRMVIVHPFHRLSTSQARQVLPQRVDLGIAIHQAAQVSALVAALYSGDLALLGRTIDDRIAEPVREPLLPGFARARTAALSAGALGCSISGAGPSVFAICDRDGVAQRVCADMLSAYEAQKVRAEARIARVDTLGVRSDNLRR